MFEDAALGSCSVGSGGGCGGDIDCPGHELGDRCCGHCEDEDEDEDENRPKGRPPIVIAEERDSELEWRGGKE